MTTVPLEAPIVSSYYASGSLPRISAHSQMRRPHSRNSMSLTRSNSARNSWAINRSAPRPPIVPQSSGSSSNKSSTNQTSPNLSQASAPFPINNPRNSYTPASNGHQFIEINAASTRNKYNTLTPSEAKKLSKFMTSRPPTRTASVLSKPRPPPMVVTNLDELSITAPPPPLPFVNDTASSGAMATSGVRSSSSCSNHSYREQSHFMNMNGHSLSNNYTSRIAASSPTGTPHGYVSPEGTAKKSNGNHAAQGSPNYSESSLSFRSSLDIVDSAYGSDRLQTMSVDLGHPTYHNHHQQYLNCNTVVNPYNCNLQKHSQPQCDYRDRNNKLFEESHESVKSNHSDASKFKSLSRVSLSSSTSKVFQNQLCNLKKFFRNMPTRRSTASNTDQTKNFNINRSDTEFTLNESISQICLNRSQSPPVCPPPPGELKSMSYIQNSVNYSNYDEFTRARNQQASTLLRQQSNNHSSQSGYQDCRRSENQASMDEPEESESWQLTSLPITYERNLATVFEERQNSIDISKQFIKNNNVPPHNNNNNNNHDFDDKTPTNIYDKCFEHINPNPPPSLHSGPNSSSSQSLTSIITSDSVLDYQRQGPATSHRFSYGQPNNPNVNNSNNFGLPPRMPTNGDAIKQSNSSGSSISSSNSFVTNGLVNGSNHCDQKENLNNRNSIREIAASHYNTANVLNSNHLTNTCFETDADTTILSDTSTLNGDSNHSSYVNKCAELERTVNSLKNKLIAKEKELTDLQLKQWSSDYLVDQLKSTVTRLEKENAHLKSVMMTSNRVNL